MKDIIPITEVNTSGQERYIFNLRLVDVLRAAMFGTLDAVTNNLLHMPLHMPGHTSIWWMGILLVGKGLVNRFGSGMIMGIVSGILAVFFGLGKEGFFVFFKYFVPGMLMDFLAPFFFFRLQSVIVGGICGALASLSKLAASIAVGVITKIPMLFLTLGLGYVAISHVIWGGIGGVLGAIILKRLKPRLSNWD